MEMERGKVLVMIARGEDSREMRGKMMKRGE
jgi:hypothetical protein